MARKPTKLVPASLTVDTPDIEPATLNRLTALMVGELRKRFANGDTAALLDAVDLYMRAGMVMPTWIVDAFGANYMRWALLQAKTLDEAFGVERPKGARLKDRAKREVLKPRVVLAVLRRVKRGRPTDERLFELVGRQLGIKGSLAKDIFYAEDNRWREFFDIWPPKKF